MILILLLALALFIALLYLGRGYWAWVGAVIFALAAWATRGIGSPTLFVVIAAIAAAAALIFGNAGLRRRLVSGRLMRLFAAMLPRMGDTERIALEAGTVWWDGDLFSGKPNWHKLLQFRLQALTERERAFLDGPVEELCAMTDDWQIAQDRAIPPKIWDFLKAHGFFGMIVPESFGGLGFSAIAHSAVVLKLSSRSVPVAVTVMVPNSLGPAELLLHYGTEAQKQHYLPRLARGEEIPCFALTEPSAGSDAAATQSTGIVCRGQFEGREVIGMRLNWRKRYITLAPVATVVGLAFRLYDPDRLLGGETDLGITCALIPRGLPGMRIGDRHDPMGVPFHNGPIFGKDAFVPVDFVIGGRDGIGKGWQMLMESLAAGRSISLPAQSVGAAELATRVAGAYGTVRKQFNLQIGRFEGIEEPLARIGGLTYMMNATRTLTCGAVDAGEKPAVLSAIAKAYLTDAMRDILNDAMDIQAGAGICRGPRNILGRGFVAAPIAITVEGANILTRSLIVYGQGAIRCHPFVQAEMAAVAAGDLVRFDRALFGHIGFLFNNAARALVLGLTGGALAEVPAHKPTARHFRALSRFSAAFAAVSEAAMATLGGDLKRREKISGRLADALAWMYLGSAALKRFFDEGRPDDDRVFVDWACEHAVFQVQEALRGVLANLPNRPVARLLGGLIFPLGARHKPPSDARGAAVARRLLDGDPARERLTADIFIPPPGEKGLGNLEATLVKVVAAQKIEAKIREAVRGGKLERQNGDAALADAALKAGIITAEERRQIDEAEQARDDAIQVDAFDPEAYLSLKG